jgi:sulfite exporter TauE/SafE
VTFADYGAVFLMGLLGGAHCVGMCAPFALAVSAGARGRAGILFARHVAYQLGKATAYVFLGVVLFLAAGWVDIETSIGRVQEWLAWVAGAVMILIGIGYALEWRWSARFASEGGWTGRACGALRALWSAPNLWSAVLAGWVNGFLPCGLSFAALLFLVSRDSLEGVVAGAYVFGFGTLPALFAVGWLGERISARARGVGLRIAGVLLVGFGVLTVVRGVDAVHHWFHEHTVPAGDGGAGHEGHEGQGSS